MKYLRVEMMSSAAAPIDQMVHVQLKPRRGWRHLTGMKKIILGVALAIAAGACSPIVHPAVQQQRTQEAAAKAQQAAPVEQTAQPATESQTRQP